MTRIRAAEDVFSPFPHERVARLSDTLSILMPVHNVQKVLRRRVERLLEQASELTDHFELFILDDGSTDSTAEGAAELSQYYRQVDWMRRHSRGGLKRLVELGLDHCRGEVVMVHDGTGIPDPAGLRLLWSRREDPSLVMARHPEQIGWYMLRRQSLPSVTPKERLLAVDHEIRILRADMAGPRRHIASRPALLSQLNKLSAKD